MPCGGTICTRDFCHDLPCSENETCQNGEKGAICRCKDACGEDNLCGKNQICIQNMFDCSANCICNSGYEAVHQDDPCASFEYLCPDGSKIPAFSLLDEGEGRPFEKYDDIPNQKCNIVVNVKEGCSVFQYQYRDFTGDQVHVMKHGMRNMWSSAFETSLCCSCSPDYASALERDNAHLYHHICGPREKQPPKPVQCEPINLCGANQALINGKCSCNTGFHPIEGKKYC